MISDFPRWKRGEELFCWDKCEWHCGAKEERKKDRKQPAQQSKTGSQLVNAPGGISLHKQMAQLQHAALERLSAPENLGTKKPRISFPFFSLIQIT